ncbi:MAG: hypothetical protein ACLRTQ_05335 [Candidatus Borkfalkia sp.]
MGYRLRRIVLMPYGAIIRGDLEGISFKDEIFVALAGPLANAAAALGFITALWWLFRTPIPTRTRRRSPRSGLRLSTHCPPIPDGGRVLFCALPGGNFRARCAAPSASSPPPLGWRSHVVINNFSMLFFASFIIAGAFGGNGCRYDRIRYDVTRTLARGAEIKRVAVLESCQVKKIIGYMERGRVLELCVYSDGGELLEILDENEIVELLERADLYAPLSECLKSPV